MSNADTGTGGLSNALSSARSGELGVGVWQVERHEQTHFGGRGPAG